MRLGFSVLHRWLVLSLTLLLLSACSHLPSEELRSQRDEQSLQLATELEQQWASHPLVENFHRHLKTSKHPTITTGQEGLEAKTALQQHLFVFVPGWLYKSNPQTGADMRMQREALGQMGARVHLAHIEENASVERNAELLRDDLKTLAQQNDSIVVVSASKGGAETMMALAQQTDTPTSDWQRQVKVWINIGGALRGTALADTAMDWRVCGLISLFLVPGHSMQGVESLQVARSAKRLQTAQLPSHLQVINFLGVPMSHQISQQAQDGYQLLISYGINDGITLLRDALVESAPTIVNLGADHYFKIDDLPQRTQALAWSVVEFLSQAANLPTKTAFATQQDLGTSITLE